MSSVIPEEMKDLLDKPIVASLSTVMPDGSPQVTPVWFDYDGSNIRINSAKGRVKDKNMRRDPRVAIVMTEPTAGSIIFGGRRTSWLASPVSAERPCPLFS